VVYTLRYDSEEKDAFGSAGALGESTQSRARALAKQRQLQMKRRQQSLATSGSMMRGGAMGASGASFTPGVAQFSAPRAVEDDGYGFRGWGRRGCDARRVESARFDGDASPGDAFDARHFFTTCPRRASRESPLKSVATAEELMLRRPRRALARVLAQPLRGRDPASGIFGRPGGLSDVERSTRHAILSKDGRILTKTFLRRHEGLRRAQRRGRARLKVWRALRPRGPRPAAAPAARRPPARRPRRPRARPPGPHRVPRGLGPLRQAPRRAAHRGARVRAAAAARGAPGEGARAAARGALRARARAPGTGSRSGPASVLHAAPRRASRRRQRITAQTLLLGARRGNTVDGGTPYP
jgi:hypothetical protein